jgi:hypothetical protein
MCNNKDNKETRSMTATNINEVAETFKKKYNFPDISSIDVDEEGETINVHTHNAKIWVDLPEYHEGYYVKMNVYRKFRR